MWEEEAELCFLPWRKQSGVSSKGNLPEFGSHQTNEPRPSKEVVLEWFQTNPGVKEIRYKCNRTLSDLLNKKKPPILVRMGTFLFGALCERIAYSLDFHTCAANVSMVTPLQSVHIYNVTYTQSICPHTPHIASNGLIALICVDLLHKIHRISVCKIKKCEAHSVLRTNKFWPSNGGI